MNISKSLIVKLLKQGTLKITFTKASGEERVMKCSLDPSLLPVVEIVEGAEPKVKRKPNPDLVNAFDLEKQEWRSFRIDSIKSIIEEFIEE